MVIGRIKSKIMILIVLLVLMQCFHAVTADDDVIDFLPAILAAIQKPENGIQNGWYVNQQKEVIWGYAGHNSWWRSDPLRPNITRIGGGAGPLHEVEFSPFIDSMLAFGFPGFEHNYGLWYDRRRDSHDTVCRLDDEVIGPVLELPWARSGLGRACDGKSLYDLDSFNPVYFDRIASFAALAQQKGAIFINNFYMQHALLDLDTHYVDFPWRPGNNIQNVQMPTGVPAASDFYNILDPQIRALHVKYINKQLDTLGDYSDVVHFTSQQYTGSLSFMQFWVDTIKQWEKDNGKQVHIGLGATKDVQDAILSDATRRKDIGSINLQYWWYQSNGALFAPPGGWNYSGKYSSGFDSSETTAEQIYRQVRKYRELHPKKAILHTINADLRQTWAFLMGGGSMLIKRMVYASSEERDYVAPVYSQIIQATYDFINLYLKTKLTSVYPRDLALNASETTWCLSDMNKTYLYFVMNGGSFQADLRNSSGQLAALWFNPVSNATLSAGNVQGGTTPQFTAPTSDDWSLLITQ